MAIATEAQDEPHITMGKGRMRHYTLGISLLLTWGCSAPANEPSVQRDSAAQRTRDSAIGASGLPGATGISGALKVADSAALRRQREDSISGSP